VDSWKAVNTSNNDFVPPICRSHGFPDDANTAGLVSGCFMGAYSLGGAVGPPISGALYDAFGFRSAELFVAGTALFLVKF